MCVTEFHFGGKTGGMRPNRVYLGMLEYGAVISAVGKILRCFAAAITWWILTPPRRIDRDTLDRPFELEGHLLSLRVNFLANVSLFKVSVFSGFRYSEY